MDDHLDFDLVVSVRRCFAVVVMAGVLAGVPAGRLSARTESLPVTSYVALGDSFAAGPLIPTQLADPAGCLRSDHDYPHLLAAALKVSSFHDATCFGATTADMSNPENVMPGPNPPQLASLAPTTTLVTLEIGGNDIKLGDFASSCFTTAPTGTPCQDHYVHNGDDQISDRIAAAAPQIANVLQAIHAHAPLARVEVVAYLDIFPETGSGCFPEVPIAVADLPYVRAKEHELNAMLAHEAVSNNATFVDAYTASIGHDACQAPCQRWVEPPVPSSPAAPLHPNLAGMKGTTAAILGDSAPSTDACVVLVPARFTG